MKKIFTYFQNRLDEYYRSKSGQIVTKIEEIVEPLDLILVRTNWYPSNLLISGYWSHAILKTYDDFYIEAVPEKNIILSSPQEALGHRSNFLILRNSLPKVDNPREEFETLISSFIGKPYDYFYRFSETTDDFQYYCTELIWRVHSKLYPLFNSSFKTKKNQIQKTIVKIADNFGYGEPILVDDFLQNKFYIPVYESSIK